MFAYKIKKKNKPNAILNKKHIYQVYLNWCKNNNLTPITEERFNKLADEKGAINISEIITLHPEFSLEESSSDRTFNDDEAKKLKEEDERKKRDQDFVNSTIIGYLTNSTTKGTTFGGSLFGGMLGSHLSKRKKGKHKKR